MRGKTGMVLDSFNIKYTKINGKIVITEKGKEFNLDNTYNKTLIICKWRNILVSPESECR